MAKELTEDEIVAELKRCKSDPIYFIETYCWIELEGLPVLFKLFEYQKQYIKTVLGNKYVIVNKSRQLGLSQTTGALILWYCLFNKNKEAVVVSLNDKEAMYFLERRVKNVFDKLPPWLSGGTPNYNEHKIKFDTGSKVEAIATTKKSLRGRSPSMVLIDEVAFHQWADELISSALPSLQLGEHLILISTPNGTAGIGAYFYETWNKAKANESEFKPFEIHWWECPLYNKEDCPNEVPWETNKWAMSQFKSYTNQALFKQEILGEWTMAGETVLPNKTLEELYASQPIRCDFIKEVTFTPEDVASFPATGWDERFSYAKGLWIWKEPEPDHYYVLGADISTGRADDHSTIEVIDLNTMEQVAEYRNRIPTSFFFDIIHNIALYYNNAFIAIETNTDETVINKLVEVGYDNMYYRMKGAGNGAMYPGWNTNLKTRGMLVSHLQDIMINKKIKVNSFRLISELKTFVWEGGKAQAAKKAHDDLVFGFMIGTFVIEEYVSQQSIGINIKDGKPDKDFDNILTPFSSSQELNIDSNKQKIEEMVDYGSKLEDDYEIDRSHYEFIGYNKDGTKMGGGS